jgi:hypothetical protein
VVIRRSGATNELDCAYAAVRLIMKSLDSGLRVWGRPNAMMSRELELIPKEHWEDWEIDPTDVLVGDPEPLSTSYREYSAKRGVSYRDLHFNKWELWQLFNLPWHAGAKRLTSKKKTLGPGQVSGG